MSNKQQGQHRATPVSRRAVVVGSAAIVGASVLPRSALANATDWSKSAHGLSFFGDLKQPVDFPHFGFVNPKAPKGGTLSMQLSTTAGNQNFNTFNSMNVFILKGDGAAGVTSTFDTLMSGSGDEPDAAYGLVADRVLKTEGKPEWRFRLRSIARFHDGSPLTAADVVFSLDLMKTKADVLRIELTPNPPRDLILTIAGMPIFSKAYYSVKSFDETTLEPPLGSGPYKVGRFEVGRFIELDRVADYWGKDLPVNVGQNNFDKLRYEYFRDRTVAFENFKSRTFTMRQEFTSRTWATGYDFPAAKDGRVVRDQIRTGGPSSIQGWYLNMRRVKFQDARVREAILLAFDFEWTNATLMFGSYKRTSSFFQNTPLAAKGAPSAAELALLEPFRAALPPEVFGEPLMPPISDGSGQDRNMLRRAGQLLSEAGLRREANGSLRLPNGQPLQIEFLDFEPSLQPHVGGFIKNLKLIGIDCSIRTVDATQYQKRTDEFDFDITMRNMGGTLTPGDGLRGVYGSEAAKRNGSRNLSGVAIPAADALIDRIARATTREDLNIAASALDRVLRATRFFVPAWHNYSAWIAHWDIYSRAPRPPEFASTSSFTGIAAATWWYDEEKAKRMGL
jgi:microcin C transport system substrate-binding protein